MSGAMKEWSQPTGGPVASIIRSFPAFVSFKETKAGNDLKMGNGYPDRVKKAYDKGAISRSEMETSVKRILGLILKLD